MGADLFGEERTREQGIPVTGEITYPTRPGNVGREALRVQQSSCVSLLQKISTLWRCTRQLRLTRAGMMSRAALPDCLSQLQVYSDLGLRRSFRVVPSALLSNARPAIELDR